MFFFKKEQRLLFFSHFMWFTPQSHLFFNPQQRGKITLNRQILELSQLPLTKSVANLHIIYDNPPYLYNKNGSFYKKSLSHLSWFIVHYKFRL